MMSQFLLQLFPLEAGLQRERGLQASQMKPSQAPQHSGYAAAAVRPNHTVHSQKMPIAMGIMHYCYALLYI